MSSMCCARRKNDGVVDEVEIDRAVAGQRAKLSPAELDVVVWRLASQRQWGCKRIAAHLSYGKTHINTVMNRLGIADPERRP